MAAFEAPYARHPWTAMREDWEDTFTIEPGLFSVISFLAKTWLMLITGLTLVSICLLSKEIMVLFSLFLLFVSNLRI